MVAASGDESYVDDDGSSGSSSSSSSGGGSSGDAPVNDDAVPAAETGVPPAVVASGRVQGARRGAGNIAGRTGGRGGGRGGGRAAGRGAGRGGRGRGRGRGEGGRPIGRTNYSQTEIFNMLDSIREYLPISGMEWDLVAQRHMAFHPDEERTGDQLKKKFNKLSKVKMGTGDPNMPPDVREAKDIRRLIIEKSEGVTGSEEEIFALDEVEEEEEESTENEPNPNASDANNGFINGAIVGPDMSTNATGETQAVAGLDGRGTATGARLTVRSVRGGGTTMLSPRPVVSISSFHSSCYHLFLIILTPHRSEELF